MQNETVFTAERDTRSCFQEFSVIFHYWTEQLLMICKDVLHRSDRIVESCGARRLTLRSVMCACAQVWLEVHHGGHSGSFLTWLQAGNVAQ